MTFIVEMVRGEPEKENFQSFDLDLWTWRVLLEFGKINGWQPIGTLPDAQYSDRFPEYMSKFKNDYEPNEWMYCKHFSPSDALELANALKLGISRVLEGKIPPPVREGPSILNEDSGYVSPDISKNPYLKQAEQFSQFLAAGSFVFAFDD